MPLLKENAESFLRGCSGDGRPFPAPPGELGGCRRLSPASPRRHGGRIAGLGNESMPSASSSPLPDSRNPSSAQETTGFQSCSWRTRWLGRRGDSGATRPPYSYQLPAPTGKASLPTPLRAPSPKLSKVPSQRNPDRDTVTACPLPEQQPPSRSHGHPHFNQNHRPRRRGAAVSRMYSFIRSERRAFFK